MKAYDEKYGRRNSSKLTFIFNERVMINERTSLNQRTYLQLINDVRAMNEKLLESANELRTINKPLFTINERTLFKQRAVHNESTMFTINEPVAYFQ